RHLTLSSRSSPLFCRSSLLIFLCPPPSPPFSTPFPYTTLFRSELTITCHPRGASITAGPSKKAAAHNLPPATTAQPGEPPATAQDRKSTRLNSSHQIISYAVFCLKKKKKHFN